MLVYRYPKDIIGNSLIRSGMFKAVSIVLVDHKSRPDLRQQNDQSS
jgi:hypothetical protein